LADVFALQDKHTRQIVTALALKLTAGAGAEQIPNETDSPQAYDAFTNQTDVNEAIAADELDKLLMDAKKERGRPKWKAAR